MTTTIRYDRLRELRTFFASISVEQINLDLWFGLIDKAGNPLDVYLEPTPGCGTAGCLLGWAASYPPFVAEGLKLMQVGRRRVSEPWFDNSSCVYAGAGAGAAFFGLDLITAGELFDSMPSPWEDDDYDEDNPPPTITAADHRKVALERLDAVLATEPK